MSAFWKHYASMNDDIRHKLVEEAWFGRQVTGDAMSEDVASQQQKTEQEAPRKRHAFYEEVWGTEATHADIYGQGPVIDGTPAIEPPAEQPALGYQPETGPEPEV